MDYHHIVPSLKQITVTEITVLMLTEEYERRIYGFDVNSGIRWDVEKWTTENVCKLKVPVELKNEIVKRINPIYDQMMVWSAYHETFYDSAGKLFKCELFFHKLCWTVNGIIDKKKTAELLIEDERLDVCIRYQLACVYCFENDIPKLWNELPVWYQKKIIDKDARCYREFELVNLWSCHINGMKLTINNIIDDGSQLCFHSHALHYATAYGNKVAIEYFLQKLDPKVRDESLLNCVRLLIQKLSEFDELSTYEPLEYYDQALCYLFLQMSENQEMEALRRYGLNILNCFLLWPWLHLYIPTVKRMRDFLTKKDYAVLLETIAEKAMDNLEVSKYQTLFQNLWQLIPVASKRYVTHMVCSEGLLLRHLFSLEDRENIALILSNGSPEERSSAIFSDEGSDVCKDLIYQLNWGMVRFFIEQCITSKNLFDQFKAERINDGIVVEGLSEDNLKKFHELLDDIAKKWK